MLVSMGVKTAKRHRVVTGEVTISMWIGTMKDTTMNVAKPAERSTDAVEMDK